MDKVTDPEAKLNRLEGMAKGLEAVAKQRQEIRLSHETLSATAWIKRDSPPGVGWILYRKGFEKRYLATRELAIARWKELDRVPNN